MTDAAPPLIDTTTMVTRIRDYGLTTTNQVVTMMMSGVFATSALAIADIMRTPDEFWVRLTLWFAASVGASLTLTPQLHGNSLIVHPSPWHIPAQLLTGFVIASGFAFIPLSTGGADGWRLLYPLGMLVAGVGIASWTLLARNTRPEYFAPELRAAVKRRVETNQRVVRLLPLFLLLFGVGTVAAWRSQSTPDPWLQVLVGLNVLQCLGGIVAIAIEMRAFQAFLDDIEAVRVAALRGDAAK